MADMMRKTKQWEMKEENRFGTHEMIHAYKVDPKTVVKLIEPPRLSEAETLRFVRSQTGRVGGLVRMWWRRSYLLIRWKMPL